MKPDVLHTHTFKAGFIGRIKTSEINKAAGKRVKFVHTFHGHLFDDPEFSGFKTSVITAIERYLAKKTTTLVTVGKRVGDLSEAAKVRVALISRFGGAILPDRDTVLQEGDLIHAIYQVQDRDFVENVFATGPKD